MDKIEKIRWFVKELQQDFISIHPKDCSLKLVKSYAGYAYLDKVLSFLDTLSEEPDKSLEEVAYKYSFDSRSSIYGQVDVIDAFKAGAKWQKESQMLKDAVEGEIQMRYSGSLCAKTIRVINEDKFKLGDKVRIIIVKED